MLAAVLLAVTASRWYQREFERIQEEIQRGQIDPARARIDRLARFGLGAHELDYWLGACEEAGGDFDGALTTWARIPAGSPRHADAALRRARLAIERGRFALAEEALAQAAFPRQSPAGEMSQSYRQQLYLLTGRLDELRRSIEGEWGGPRSRAEVLRTRWLADDASSSAFDAVERRLDEAGRAAPEDDRVWLGRAYLAIRRGAFDEAGAWLKKCLCEPTGGPGRLAGTAGMGDGLGRRR